MRITNQMITGNSLRNMQKSMSEVNTRTNQMTTGKKISKASEDPVIAIRALKLRTTVRQLEQYKGKNIPDAESWLKITNTSMENITKRITDISEYCVQGSTDSFSTTDRSAIVDALKQLRSMIYDEGNSTYAGRYIFSGFKTDRSLAFSETEDTSIYSYDITQHVKPGSIDTKNVVLDEVDYTKVDDYINDPSTYKQINPEKVYRIHLAYNDIDRANNEGTDVLNINATDAAGNAIDLTGFTINVKETTDADTYYKVADNEINVIKETGEIIFGENVYNTLKAADDISVTYAKNNVQSGELRPEHYFDCIQHVVQTDGSVKDITYDKPEEGQSIYYEVNFNQSLKVNTEGNKVIPEYIGGYIDDLIYTLDELDAAEKTKIKLEAMLDDPVYSANQDAINQIKRMISDADIEVAAKKENLQKTFSQNITNFKDYLSTISAIQSDIGSRMSKLEMIQTRVTEQYAEFKELKSTNEDVETDEVIIDFNEANLVYESALAATSNIMTKTLLDYI